MMMGGMMKKVKIGQSTMEYIILFAIVVGAIILAANNLKPKIQKAYGHLSAGITSKVNE